jgi:hypothetical protein
MKKFLIIFLLSFLPAFVIAQINLDTIISRERPKLIEPNLYPPIVYPDIYIQIDTFNIKLDTLSLKLIDPSWIRRVVILKEKKYKELFGDSKPVLLIYPKKKYKKEISDLFIKK